VSALCLALVHAEAQEPTPAAAVARPAASGDLQKGPATIPQHWSRYKYPESIPEGATYYIIQRGDTLWDLSAKYLGNPFLWPQIWDQNRYITDAHWIYPGDPLILPEVALVTDRAGEAGSISGEPTEEGMPGQSTTASGDVLYPAIELRGTITTKDATVGFATHVGAVDLDTVGVSRRRQPPPSVLVA